MIHERLGFYDEIFGSYSKDEYVQFYPAAKELSLVMDLFWAPTEFTFNRNSDFQIEFGRYEIQYEYSIAIHEYFNIIYNGTVIGTCDYNKGCYISHTGMQDYIINRLTTLKGAQE